MTKNEIIRWAYGTDEGKPYSFLVNVITCQYGKQIKLLKGLYKLAQQDRVGNGNSIDTVTIDGCIVTMKELEKYV